MKRLFITLAAAVSLVAPAAAQSPLQRALADLKSAQADLAAVQNETTALRSALYREINTLDDESIQLSRDLQKLDRDWTMRTAKARSLQRTVDAREAESKFVSGVLATHIGSFTARLAAAERQLYIDAIDGHMTTASASGDDLVARLDSELAVVELGMDRLTEVANGQIFEGRGLDGGESLSGTFALVGPSAYFVADGGFTGISDFGVDAAITTPRIVDLLDHQGAAIRDFIENGAGLLPYDASMGKAIIVQRADESLAETAKKGGIVGYAILGLGAVAILLAIFKVFEILRFQVPDHKTINGVLDDLIAHDPEAALAKTAHIHGPSKGLIKAGIDNFYGKRRIMEEALFEKLLGIKPKLDRFLPFLSLVAAAAPLMGLLGTVLGIIKTFKQMAIYGTGDAKSFSAGISEALITTAEGLVVAIPVLIIHGMLRSLSKGKFADVEAVAVSMMNATSELEDKPVDPVEDNESTDDESLTAA